MTRGVETTKCCISTSQEDRFLPTQFLDSRRDNCRELCPERDGIRGTSWRSLPGEGKIQGYVVHIRILSNEMYVHIHIYVACLCKCMHHLMVYIYIYIYICHLYSIFMMACICILYSELVVGPHVCRVQVSI